MIFVTGLTSRSFSGYKRQRYLSRSSWEMGLRDVAELCRRDYAARPGRDCNAVRDQLLLIAIEWDLTRDRLDQQSHTCLRAIAEFLR